MEEKMYAMILGPAGNDGQSDGTAPEVGADGYTHGPTPDLKSLVDRIGPNDTAVIHQLIPDGNNLFICKHHNGEWDYSNEERPGGGESDIVPWEVLEAEPFARNSRHQLVLDELQLTGADNEVMMVSCKVVGFTAEAKVQPAQYEQARGYVQLEPRDLWIHVPILNPGQKVTNSGDVEIFGAVFRYIARELDMAVFNVASERLDLRTSIKDAAEVKATSRFDTGRKVVQTKTEVL